MNGNHSIKKMKTFRNKICCCRFYVSKTDSEKFINPIKLIILQRKKNHRKQKQKTKNKTKDQNISHCFTSVYDSLYFHKLFVIYDKHLKWCISSCEFKFWFFVLSLLFRPFLWPELNVFRKKHILLSTQEKKKHFYTKMRLIHFVYWEITDIFFFAWCRFFMAIPRKTHESFLCKHEEFCIWLKLFIDEFIVARFNLLCEAFQFEWKCIGASTACAVGEMPLWIQCHWILIFLSSLLFTCTFHAFALWKWQNQ